MRALSFVPADRHFTGAFLLAAFAFIILEFAYGRLAHHEEMHDAKETLASVGVALGNVIAKAVTSGLSAVPFFFVYQHRLTDIPLDTIWSWFALFLGVEFFYYWFHLASHRVRWLWATHAVHHSATRFNLSAGYISSSCTPRCRFISARWNGCSTPPVTIACTTPAMRLASTPIMARH